MSLQEKYPFVYGTPVKWGELDALRHLNNTVYFRYCEEARIQMLSAFEESDFLKADQGPVLAYIDCKFLAPVLYPDTILVGTWVDQIGYSSMQLIQHVYSGEKNTLAAVSKSVLVFLNYQTGEKIRVSGALRQAIESLQSDFDLLDLAGD